MLEHLAKKYSKVKKGVGDIMGGKILDYPTKDAFKKGKKEQLISQIQRKLAKGKSIEVIADEVEETIETVTEIIKELEEKSNVH